MTRSWWGKLVFLAFVTVLSAIYVYPTVAKLDLEKTRFPFKQKINLGLDLQGGLYMVLGADFNKVFHDVVERQGASLESMLKEKAIPYTSVKVVTQNAAADDPRIAVEYPSANRDAIYQVWKTNFDYTLRLAGDTPGRMELGLGTQYRNDVRDRTVNQSIEVVRNRIDEFGVSEPIISSQGNDRLVVELPGVKEVERAKDLIGQTAKLEFKFVDDKAMDPALVAGLVSKIEKDHNLAYKEGQKFSEYVQAINQFAHQPDASGKPGIPETDEIAFEREKSTVPGAKTANLARIPYLLKSKADVTGEELQDANVELDQETRNPDVGFTLNPRGAAIFDKLTSENIGKRFAIVLDGIIHSAPVIQGRIPGGRGRITLGQGRDPDAMMKEAKDLSIVLRAGALPAQLEFLEERVIGPSLGEDSIKKGAFASLVGTLMVFLFVAFYYRVSGLIAVLSLLLNVLYVLATLVGLEATLTLPGIAGIALTVGIAVDSNVVIYERIREELRAGKNPHGAVESGFQKAFRTIMDANVTNAAAALVLLAYGTGPIKGFAVTLLIGIVTTLFTAVFVCKVMFDAYLHSVESRGKQTLSI